MEGNFFKRESLFEEKFEKDNCGMGFIANINGIKTNKTIIDGIKILRGLEHRGASGYDSETGDGAGLLFEVPDEFFRDMYKELPKFGDYGVGNIFFPVDEKEREEIKQIISEVVNEEKEEVLFFREVPIKKDAVGREAQRTLPHIEQLFIKKLDFDHKDFEKKLYIIRKKIERKDQKHM